MKVKVRSSMNDVVKNSDGTYTAFLMSAPVEGKANEELIELLSEKFDVAKSSLKIVKGYHSRNKIVEIAIVTAQKTKEFSKDGRGAFSV